MDQATIDAMRTVVDMIDKMVKRSDGYGRDIVNTLDGEMAVSTHRAAVEGLHELVERAAAERVVPAVKTDDPLRREQLMALLETLRSVTTKDEPPCNVVRFQSEKGHSYVLAAACVREAIRNIEALLAAPPTKPAEPTLEECVAAMNRAKVRGNADWHIMLTSKADNLRFFCDETFAIGKMLIERERAEAAKGGA